MRGIKGERERESGVNQEGMVRVIRGERKERLERRRNIFFQNFL